MAGIEQLIYVLMVNLATFTLSVRPMIADSLNLVVAIHAQPFVYSDAEPFKGFENILFGSRHKTGGVRIFNTEQHISTMLTGKQIIIQGSTHTADMQRSGW